MVTKKPRKQRKALREAPLHKKQKLLASHLSKELRKKYKKRNMPVRKGDEVKILRGTYRGQAGKIARVNLKKLKVYMEKIKRKKVSGEEVAVPFRPSNLMITSLNLDDKKRQKILERKEKK